MGDTFESGDADISYPNVRLESMSATPRLRTGDAKAF
jgi:hypothetical protein